MRAQDRGQRTEKNQSLLTSAPTISNQFPNRSALTSLASASASPPRRFSTKCAPEMKLFVQDTSLTRKALPPELLIARSVNRLPVHCVPGKNFHPTAVSSAACAINTP